MPPFSVNASRHDPYKTFKFRVVLDGRVVAGVARVSALKRTTEVIAHREGGDPSTRRLSPGATRYEPITLERGLTHDSTFEEWANLAWRLGAGLGNEVALRDFRKDLAIEVMNEAGQIVFRYLVHCAWVSEYVALPDLDADCAAVAFETIVIQHEGFERDEAVVEPAEPGAGKAKGK
jgi:phage tail-like protein